jgi:hypothetical protein
LHEGAELAAEAEGNASTDYADDTDFQEQVRGGVIQLRSSRICGCVPTPSSIYVNLRNLWMIPRLQPG